MIDGMRRWDHDLVFIRDLDVNAGAALSFLQPDDLSPIAAATAIVLGSDSVVPVPGFPSASTPPTTTASTTHPDSASATAEATATSTTLTELTSSSLSTTSTLLSTTPTATSTSSSSLSSALGESSQAQRPSSSMSTSAALETVMSSTFASAALGSVSSPASTSGVHIAHSAGSTGTSVKIAAAAAVTSLVGAMAIAILVLFFCRRKRQMKKMPPGKDDIIGQDSFDGVQEAHLPARSIGAGWQPKLNPGIQVSVAEQWEYQKSFAAATNTPHVRPTSKSGGFLNMRKYLMAPLASNPLNESLKGRKSMDDSENDLPMEWADEKRSTIHEGGSQTNTVPSTSRLYLQARAPLRNLSRDSQTGPDAKSIRTESSAVLGDRENIASGQWPLSVPSGTQSATSVNTLSLLRLPKENQRSFFSWSDSRHTASDDMAAGNYPQTPRTTLTHSPRTSLRDTLMTSFTDSSEPPRHRSIRSWVINQQLRRERSEDRLRAIDNVDVEKKYLQSKLRHTITSTLSLSSEQSSTLPMQGLQLAKAQSIIIPSAPARVLDNKAHPTTSQRRQTPLVPFDYANMPQDRTKSPRIQSFLDTTEDNNALGGVDVAQSPRLQQRERRRTFDFNKTMSSLIMRATDEASPLPTQRQQDYGWGRKKKRESAGTNRTTLSLFRVHPGEKWDPRNG